MAGKKIVLLNKGPRAHHIPISKNEEGVWKPYNLQPGQSVEVDTEIVEKFALLGYPDLVDAAKAAPAVAATIEALREENAKLQARVKELEEEAEGKKKK